MRHTDDLIGVLSLKHYTYIFNTATNLYSMFSSVHVISKEKKAGRCKNWAHPPQNFLKANQVVKIAVKVTWKKNSCKNSTKPLPSVLYWGQFSRETTSVLYESDPCFCTSPHKFGFKKSLYSSRLQLTMVICRIIFSSWHRVHLRIRNPGDNVFWRAL